MSGEAITVVGTTKVLESNGPAITNGSVVQAAVASYDQLGADGAGFPDGRFVLTCVFGAAPALNAAVMLFARELAVDGATNTEVPTAAHPGRVIGSFLVSASTSQTLTLTAYDLPAKADYYLYNNATGQSITAGWSLKVTPRSYKAAP